MYRFQLSFRIRGLQVQTNSTGATLNEIIQILGYADDLDLLVDDKETVTKNAEILIAKSKDIGLEDSETKTKYMIVDRLKQINEDGDLVAGNMKFERVSKFK